ncbi:MAG: bifunctional N-acetylglucosamine-1-phosphate uridyltransferase/glucosamine-1-phosphate acetyltransferase [Candidatus Omnitrophica bacterium]|nr:bifunctional N-acetylglucosamine-1-phosphate uridyltransferase/glucosamine-1-phosphate acetyltransferase [Candidatus Omnitrophota bacterium]
MRILHAIILAAGEGTRMKSELPKVLHPICGRPMMAYAIDLVASAGVKQPIIVLGDGAELVKPILPKEAKTVIQTKRLGTGDAVSVAKKSLSSNAGAVLILYADTPLLRRTTVQKLIESHFKTGATCTLLAAHLADPSGYGRISRNEAGQIIGIIEEAEANAAQRAIREINVGPLVCNTQALVEALATLTPSASKKELYLTDIVSHIASQPGTKIQATRVEEVSEALGINSRTELARAIGVIRQRIIDAHLHNGVTIEDPQTTFIDHGVTIGVDTTVHPYTVIHTGVAIGKRCSIGPFARLRTGTTVSDDARIGNFVELVRTKIGHRVRVNHMTYLGDAIVEDDVNIGAGTVTANYDGQEKHQTQIGKGAFIGSDTILIAPVKVGAGAKTGAGSVIPKAHDVAARSVVVGVPAHVLDHRKAVPAEASEKTQRNGSASKAKPAPARQAVRKAMAVKRVKVARKAAKAARKPARRTVPKKKTKVAKKTRQKTRQKARR